MHSQRDIRIAATKASTENFTIHELDWRTTRLAHLSRPVVEKKRNEWLAHAQNVLFFEIVFYFI